MRAAVVRRPLVTVAFPDGCFVVYSHPDDERYPRADLTLVPEGHHHDSEDDGDISRAVGHAFLEALSHSIYEAKVVRHVRMKAAPSQPIGDQP
jgi:hypothetical protein